MLTYAGRPINLQWLYLRVVPCLLIAWLLTLALRSSLLTSHEGPRTEKVTALGELPISFEANEGQIDQSVFFTARAGASTYYFTRSEVVISLAAPLIPAPPLTSGNLNLHEASNPAGQPTVMRLSFVGASPEPHILPGSQLPGTVNYFLGNDPDKWQTGLPTFGDITYSGLYPGIDLQFEGTQRTLKGTYTLAAGADPTVIRWRYEGAETLNVDANGDLLVTLQSAKLIEAAPVAWQEIESKRIPVQVSYALATDNSVGFVLGKYDPAHELIIDPTLTYSTFLGGSGMEEGFAIAVDSQGNAYVTGATSSTDFPVVNPLYPPSSNGDLFVTKINPDASAIVYSTYIGGESSDVGFGIAVDATGSAYVTGESLSFTFPTVNAYQPEHAGYPSYNFDAILLKINPAGTALVYSTFLGDLSDDEARDVTVDSQGSAYITGHTLSVLFPLANPFQPSLRGIQDGFVTKFSPDGSALVFSTYLGGSTDLDYSNSIAIDSQGGVYVAGFTGATDFPMHNPIQPTNHGNGDTFITKFNPSGTSLAYSTYLGGSDNDIQYSGLAVDPSGNAYVSGYTSSTDFPVANAYQSVKNGFEDVFLTKINAAGTAWVYSTYLGGIFPDGNYHTDVAADSEGNAYVGGDTRSSDFPLVNNFQTGNIDASYRDVFVTKFDPSGQELIYSTRLGGNNGGHFNNLEHLYGLVLDAAGNVYITGATDSPQFPVTSGVFQPTKAPYFDTFMSKISAQGPNTPTPTVTGTPPTATSTPCNIDANYTVSQQTGVSIIPGTYDIGNHCEACVTPLTLPFPVRLYDRTFTSALVGNNGVVGFVANQNFSVNQCLPPTEPPMFNYAILPFWTEVRTDGYGITCPNGCGIFTSITGSAPNRTLTIEWRGSRFYNGNFGYVNFELRLFESSSSFQVVYGQLFPNSGDATIGAQKDTGSLYAQYACDTGSITPGTALTFSLPNCGPQPTTTLTPSSTAASITTATRTAATVVSATPTRTTTPPGVTPTPCSVQFTDVPTGHTFYAYIRCLSCRGIINGYPDGTFRPAVSVTRGQLSKIVANAAGFTEPAGQQRYEDVVPGSTFFDFIWRLADRGHVSGYPCGDVGEPCGPNNLPYFRPNGNATRGQISKVVSNAAGFSEPVEGQTFEDVPPQHTFYEWIERLAMRQIMSGYPCGGVGEPCGSDNRPYFRPASNTTRGQTAKIVANSFYPNCQTP